MKYLPEFSRCN